MAPAIFAIATGISSCGSGHIGSPGGSALVDASLLSPDADPSSGGPPDARTVDADPTSLPRTEVVPCRFEIPPTIEQSFPYECGDLVTYEDRSTASSEIRLHYIRLISDHATGRATIYLAGGPGGSGQTILSYIDSVGVEFGTQLMSDGDLLVISQRGTLYSVPFLDCPDSCAHIEPPPDLSTYNTAFNADDVNELRSVLGYEHLNLYGISYGSRLALEVLRRHGEHVRAAIIGGVVPSQTVWPAYVPASFYSALVALSGSCTAKASCQSAYGDLEQRFYDAVTTLDANPLDFANEGFSLDGTTFAWVLQQALYARGLHASLPLLIHDVASRRTDRVGSLLAQIFSIFSSDRGLSEGLYYSVVCGELFNPPRSDAYYDSVNAGVPSAIRSTMSYSWPSLRDACASWPLGDPLPDLAEPVVSTVPTLVVSGALDPITPPSFGDIAATTLASSTSVIVEDSGHGATLQSDCGRALLAEFLAAPTTPLDTGCAASVTTTYLLPPTAKLPQIERRQLLLELQRAPPLPWAIAQRLIPLGSADE